MFREILDSIPAAVYTTDAQGRLTHFNKAAVEFSGRVPNLGTDHWCVSWKLYESDGTPLPHDQCPMAVALKEARSIRGAEAIAERPDGTRIAFMPFPTPLHDEQGRLIGGVNMLVDITQRKSAERELERRTRHLAAFLETAAIGLHRVGADGEILWANDAELKMLGYAREEYVGQHIAKFHADSQVINDILGCLGRGEKLVDREARLKCKDGAIKTVLIDSSALWEDGQFVHTQCFTRDITELRQVEKRKDDFLATLSHELRNPLAPISNTVSLLAQHGDDASIRNKCVAILDRQVRHVAKLVDDLMDINRISRGSIALDKRILDVADIVSASVETSQPLMQQARHQLDVSLPGERVCVHADSVRMTQIVTNLLNNAAKFTPRNGKISILVAATPDFAEITIQDNGNGISGAQMPDLFEMFNPSRQGVMNGSSGLGIGLSLARGLARLHGGDILARSEGPGQGSAFTLRIPRVQEPAATDGTAADRPHAETAPYTVLVADDNVDAAETTRMLLELRGFRVEVVHDGRAAVDASIARRPDILLLDLSLPGLDGFDVVRALRQNDATRDLRIVALTGHGLELYRDRCLQSGFDDHLVKPADPERLASLVMSSRGTKLAQG